MPLVISNTIKQTFLAGVTIAATAAWTIGTRSPLVGGVLFALGQGLAWWGRSKIEAYLANQPQVHQQLPAQREPQAQQPSQPLASKVEPPLPQSAPLGATIGTYNILCPPHNGCGEKGKKRLGNSDNLFQYTLINEKYYDNTEERTAKTIKNLKQANLDIVCLQEATVPTVTKIRNAFAEYNTVYAKHKPSEEEGHGVAILYNKNRFEQVNQKIIEKDFQIIQKNGVIKDQPRAAMMVDLREKTTGKVIRVVSAHFFDPNSFKSDRGQYAEWLVGQVKNQPYNGYSLDKIVIAGDMNQDQHGDRISRQYSGPTESDRSEGTGEPKDAAAFRPFTHNGFQCDKNLGSTEFYKDEETAQPVNKNRKIDWIWVQGGKPTNYKICGFDLTASDHKLFASTI